MGITWDPSMSTGFETVDGQHKKLFHALNALIDAMRAGEAREQLEPLLNWLFAYTARHFASEEICMALHHCPAAAANKAAHAEFLQTLKTLQIRIATVGISADQATELEQQLTDWLRNHILQIDAQLLHCVNRKVA